MDRASDAIREIDIITNKEKKIYLKYAFDINEFETIDDILSFGKVGIRVASTSLTDVTEELGMLDNLKKYRPELLQAYLGGREFDPISMGAEADLKRAIAEYAMGSYNKVTCVLEIPKECRYANSLASLVPVFEMDEVTGEITIPSQYIKAIVTATPEGYKLWRGPSYDPSYEIEKGVIDEKEVNRVLHQYNVATTNPAVISYAFNFVKKDFIKTGDMGAYKRRLEIFKKIYDSKKSMKRVVERKVEPVEQQPQEREVELVPYEKKRKGFFATFFEKLKKCFFGKATVQSKH